MKAFLPFFALLLSTSCVMAQGYVVFANATTPDTRITTNINGNVGHITGIDQWAVGLYMAPMGTISPGDASWNLVAVSTNRTGLFSGLFYGYSPLQLPRGYAVGTTYATMVLVWEAKYGWDNAGYASSSLRASSGIGSITPATQAGPFPFVFGSGPGQLGAIQIAFIPEPSFLSLGVLGIGAVLAVRAKRRPEV